jgi:hypothetical protein
VTQEPPQAAEVVGVITPTEITKFYTVVLL